MTKKRLSTSNSNINLTDILNIYEQLRGKTIKELKTNEKIYIFLDEVHFWEGWQFDLKKGQSKLLLPIEVKYRNHILLRDLKGIIKFMDKYGIKEGIVVSKDLLEKREQNNKILWIIPAWLFLLIN